MIQAAALIATIAAVGAEQAKAAIAGVGAQAEATGASMSKALALGALAAGAAIVGLVAKTVLMAGDFESTTERLVTSAGEQQNALGMVRSGILKLAVDTGTSTEQLATAMYKVESSNYHAAAGLQVLTAAAQGAKTENADLAIVSQSLLGVLKNYHMPATQATSAMNGLIAVVKGGNTTLEALSVSMSQVLPTAASLGISFAQVGGAVDTMTSKTLSADQAAQNLAHVLLSLSAPGATAIKSMKEVGLSAQGVKDALAHQGLPQALQMIEDAVGKKFPKSSVEYTTAMKNIMGGLMGYKVAAQLTGASLKDTQININAITAAMKNGSGAVDGFTAIQQTFNFKMSQASEVAETLGIKIGSVLLPVVGNLISGLAQAAMSFAGWVTSGHVAADILHFIGANAQIVIPILAGLGAGIVALAVTAIPPLVAGFATWAAGAWAAALPTLALAAPIIAVAAAVAGLVAGFIALYNNNAGFRTFIGELVKSFQAVWSVIVANLIPVFHQLQQVWQQQIVPAFQQILPALKQMMPLFQLLGVVIGALVVGALGVLIGLITGLAKGIGYFVEGLAHAVSGIVQFFTGLVQIVSGVIQLVVDIIHGNWLGVAKDIAQIGQGIVNEFLGVWNTIAGIFQAAWGLISGIVGGFVQGIITFFQHLADEIVGHSIIPDMITGIFNWFAQLPGRVGGYISNMATSAINKFDALLGSGLAWAVSFVSGLMGKLGDLVGRAGTLMGTVMKTILTDLGNVGGLLAAGAHIVEQIAAGILGSIGSALGNAMSQVGSFINSHLPHSPAKMGPLVTLAQSGANIPGEIAKGMIAGMPAIQTSLHMMLSPLAQPSLALPQAPQLSAPSSGVVSGGGTSQQPINLKVDVYLNADRMGSALMPAIASAIRFGVGTHF